MSHAPKPREDTASITWEAGALVRKRIRLEVRGFLDSQDIEYDFRDDGGLFWTKYHVTITGPSAAYCRSEIRKYIAQFAA